MDSRALAFTWTPGQEPPVAHPHNSGLSGALRPVFNILIDCTCLFLHRMYMQWVEQCHPRIHVHSGPQSVTLCGSRVLGGLCPCACFRILRGNHSGFRLRPKCNDWGPRQRHREEKLRKDRQRDLPAGPVAETLCFQRRGPGFGPWSGI